MKEIITKMKSNLAYSSRTNDNCIFLDATDAQTIVTAFEQLTVLSLMYQNQIIDIDLALQDAELADQERNEMYAVKIKLQSVIQDLTKVLT